MRFSDFHSDSRSFPPRDSWACRCCPSVARLYAEGRTPADSNGRILVKITVCVSEATNRVVSDTQTTIYGPAER